MSWWRHEEIAHKILEPHFLISPSHIHIPFAGGICLIHLHSGSLTCQSHSHPTNLDTGRSGWYRDSIYSTKVLYQAASIVQSWTNWKPPKMIYKSNPWPSYAPTSRHALASSKHRRTSRATKQEPNGAPIWIWKLISNETRACRTIAGVKGGIELRGTQIHASRPQQRRTNACSASMKWGVSWAGWPGARGERGGGSSRGSSSPWPRSGAASPAGRRRGRAPPATAPPPPLSNPSSSCSSSLSPSLSLPLLLSDRWTDKEQDGREKRREEKEVEACRCF